jgi:sialate O-acetylesterase
MKRSLSRCAALALALFAWSCGVEVRAEVTLPKVIGSHMVLQRDRPLPIWGWAEPGEKVTVTLDQATAAATADARGDWKIILPAMVADGKAHRMTVCGKNRIEMEDILVGEVWLGSGQSNMDFAMVSSIGGKEEVAAANDPEIRLVHVARVSVPQPAKDVVLWCYPQELPENRKSRKPPIDPRVPAWHAWTQKDAPLKNLQWFSAPLYYFGQRLRKELHVPIGLIDASWSGSPIGPWILRDGKGGGMYNGLIAPVKPFALRGVIWYQGESDVFQNYGMKYYPRMQQLIGGWRQAWGDEFSFYFVQLAPFVGTEKVHYSEDALPAVWEAQAASLKIPRTGMIVVTDAVHDLKDIHPKDKRTVGNRLALWALAKDYGRKDLVHSGPLYKSMQVEGSKIRLRFAHVGSGLASRDGKPLSEFEIAGADDHFIPAMATIDGHTVVVEAAGLAQPTQARFGWRRDANPNLANNEGLPAAPFRTRAWQGGTGE